MKSPVQPLLFAGALVCAALSPSASGQSVVVSDPYFESFSRSDLAIWEPDSTKGQAYVGISPLQPFEGSSSLMIQAPAGAMVSVSIPLKNSRDAASISLAVRGEVASAKDAKLSLVSFTTEGGYQQVEFKPVMLASDFGAPWRERDFILKRAEAATHWQLTLTLEGPGVVWIDAIRDIVSSQP